MSLMLKMRLLLVLGVALFCLQCQPNSNGGSSNKTTTAPANGPVPKYGYQIVNIWPHDSNAFTQGLILMDGKLLESTGEVGFSSLRRVELESGKILKKVNVPEPYFAEGIALLNGKIYQLTWREHTGFVYDANTYKKLGQFAYKTEGWGLTHDTHHLIMSDGSNQ